MTPVVDRLRRIERAAIASFHAAAPPGSNLRLESVGAADVSIAGGIESIVVNRAAGLGVGRPASEPEVATIARLYDEAGIRRHLVHLDPDAGPEALPEWLERAGYRPYRGWAQFARPASAAPAAESDLRVHEVTAESARAFGRIVANGFDLGDGAVPLLAALAARPAWRAFLTMDDAGEFAGAAALFVHEGAGWLDWAATRPEHRRRGSQTALLARRIRIAREAGCEILFTETGEAVPGDAQHSYRNLLRAGFEVIRVRENRIREVDAPPG